MAGSGRSPATWGPCHQEKYSSKEEGWKQKQMSLSSHISLWELSLRNTKAANRAKEWQGCCLINSSTEKASLGGTLRTSLGSTGGTGSKLRAQQEQTWKHAGMLGRALSEQGQEYKPLLGSSRWSDCRGPVSERKSFGTNSLWAKKHLEGSGHKSDK